MRWSRHILVAGSLALVAAACGDDGGPKPIGASCAGDEQCASGLCIDDLCADPAGDADADQLTNGFEASIGSDPSAADTDGDGIADRVELGPALELTDTDGDGAADILESTVADADGDCITDQYDAQDTVPSADPSPMIPAVCRQGGICASQVSALAVDCSSGAAVCVYAGVVGFADPELACDGVDENCDGTADEGFSVAECALPVQPWVAPGNGTYETGSTRYRAAVGFGPVPARKASSTRYRIEIGFSPSLLPTEAAP